MPIPLMLQNALSYASLLYTPHIVLWTGSRGLFRRFTCVMTVYEAIPFPFFGKYLA